MKFHPTASELKNKFEVFQKDFVVPARIRIPIRIKGFKLQILEARSAQNLFGRRWNANMDSQRKAVKELNAAKSSHLEEDDRMLAGVGEEELSNINAA